MALVLLKKLKQSQQQPREVTTNLGGGATLTAAKPPSKMDPKSIQRQNSTNDLLNNDKAVGQQLFRQRGAINCKLKGEINNKMKTNSGSKNKYF